MITQGKEIKDLIYVIRGQQVMLDSDLAELYGYNAKKFNQQVKRNMDRFPDDFMFQLSYQELVIVRSQIVTSQNSALFKGQDGGRRYLPYVFTELGINMLSSVLRGDLAISQSIFIMRMFREMRHYITENQTLLNNNDLLKLSNTVYQNEKEIQSIKNKMATKSDINKIMDNFIDESNIKEITILNGQKFEAIEAYIKIYKEALHTIYIIDDYIKSPLKCKNENVAVILFSDNKGTGSHKLIQREIDVFNAEYPSLTLKRNGLAHDRYIVIDYKSDKEKIYHCGMSSKDAGRKVCGMNEMSDANVLHSTIDKLLLN